MALTGGNHYASRRQQAFWILQIVSIRAKRKVAQLSSLSAEEVEALASHGELGEVAADRMIENVIGTMSLPVGVATNFVIDGKAYLIPFCVEESSIVAAASNMAKRCLKMVDSNK